MRRPVEPFGQIRPLQAAGVAEPIPEVAGGAWAVALKALSTRVGFPRTVYWFLERLVG